MRWPQPQPPGGLSFLPAETPERKAKAAVRVQADGDLPRGVQLTLELDGSAEGVDRGVGHLQSKGARVELAQGSAALSSSAHTLRMTYGSYCFTAWPKRKPSRQVSSLQLTVSQDLS